VCGCTPSSAACGTRVCGTVSDGCGGTVSCGACSPSKTCNSAGSCVCAVSYAWNFDSNSLSGWSLAAGSGSSGSIGTAASPGRSGFSLQVANATFGGGDITVLVTLCGGTAVQFASGSFAVSVDMRFESATGVPFGDDGTGGGSPGVLADGDFGSFLIYQGPPIPLGTWQTLSRTIPAGSTSTIEFRFVPQNSWTGTIYIDNISVH
jgi:hypothetical protein